jgi:arsenite methyltransferase
MGLCSEEELTALPHMALNLSRGCGNPSGFADFQPGEAIVDFGCGEGIDVILAAHKVGAQGRVLGIDFAEPMIRRAGQAVAEAHLQDSYIELRVADLERTQLPDAFADVLPGCRCSPPSLVLLCRRLQGKGCGIVNPDAHC